MRNRARLVSAVVFVSAGVFASTPLPRATRRARPSRLSRSGPASSCGSTPRAPSPSPTFTPVASVVAGRADGMHFVVSADAGYNVGKIHIAGMRRSGSRLEVRVDGTSSVNGDAGLPDGAPVDVSAPDAAN